VAQVEEHNETYVESEKLLHQLRAALAEEVATLEAARQVPLVTCTNPNPQTLNPKPETLDAARQLSLTDHAYKARTPTPETRNP
jgi:hypothetical protein